jgi:hypothetical protein
VKRTVDLPGRIFQLEGGMERAQFRIEDALNTARLRLQYLTVLKMFAAGSKLYVHYTRRMKLKQLLMSSQVNFQNMNYTVNNSLFFFIEKEFIVY